MTTPFDVFYEWKHNFKVQDSDTILLPHVSTWHIVEFIDENKAVFSSVSQK